MPQYPARGALFNNEKGKARSDKAPDYQGNLELDEATIRYLYNLLEEGVYEGDYPKVELSAWIKKSREGGKRWMSVSAQIPYKDRDRAASMGKRNGSSREHDIGEDEIPF